MYENVSAVIAKIFVAEDIISFSEGDTFDVKAKMEIFARKEELVRALSPDEYK